MKYNKGQALVELLIAMGIFLVGIVSLAYFFLDTYLSGRVAKEITIANFLAEEGVEATRSIRDMESLSRLILAI